MNTAGRLRRLRRVVIAAAGACVLAWPLWSLMSLVATAAGLSIVWEPLFAPSSVWLAIGLVFFLERTALEWAQRLRRVVAAASGAFVLAWPLASLMGTEAGFSVMWKPSFVVSSVVLAVGLVLAGGFTALEWAQRRWADRTSRPLPEMRKTGLAAGAALLAFLAVLPLLGFPDKYRDLLLETMVYVTLVTGLNITIGMAGLLVLGHAAFWAVGAYTYVLTTVWWDWNFWVALPAAGIAAAAAGLLIGLPALRLRGDYLAVVTLGFGEVVRQTLKNASTITGGDVGVPGAEVRGNLWEPKDWAAQWLWQPGIGANGTRGVYWFALALATAAVAIAWLLVRSRFGRALFAVREDETAARCMGIDVVRMKLFAFMTSATLAGLAGVATAVHRGSISPDLFSFDQSVLCVAMVVFGGLGSVPGAVLGAAVLFALPLLLQDWVPEAQNYRMLVFGAVMAGMMAVRPGGLFRPSACSSRRSSGRDEDA